MHSLAMAPKFYGKSAPDTDEVLLITRRMSSDARCCLTRNIKYFCQYVRPGSVIGKDLDEVMLPHYLVQILPSTEGKTIC
ncbi:hypothetical protein J6590_049053 [Homalodisca vitripennis]|nr:hypothetical protein J6590_049053 [Homalodisca vitripennis]